MKSFLLGFAGALVAIALFLFGYAQYADYRSRAETGEWLVLVSSMKEQIEEVARKQNGLTALKAPKPLVTGQGAALETVVLEAGAIVLRGGTDGQVVVLAPTKTGNDIAWRCIGGSAKAMPDSCRVKP